jgi:hypothetical protein
MSVEVGCATYPLALAVEDVVPIVLGGLGYLWLSRRAARALPVVGPPMLAATALLVVCSALAGPIRKIAAWLAATPICPPDYEVPYSGLQIPFVMALGPGFAILTWGVWSVLRARKLPFWPFVIPLALGVVGAVAAGSRPILFGVGGLWAVALAVGCVVLARREADALAAALFVVYAAGTLVLPFLSSRGNVSDPVLQWTAQGVNTVTQGLFAYAAYRLLQASSRAERAPASPAPVADGPQV